MELVKFLVYTLEVLGLVFIIGILFNLILDAVIIAPIQNRRIARQRAKMIDLVLEKMENGEDIPKFDIDEIEKEIEK